MTRGGRRRASQAMTCLSCRAVLDSSRSFCDAQCEAYAKEHGYGGYGDPKGARGVPRKGTVRKDYRARR